MVCRAGFESVRPAVMQDKEGGDMYDILMVVVVVAGESRRGSGSTYGEQTHGR